MQGDPIGLEGGVNVYGYANARPTLNYDPNGLFTIKNRCQECDVAHEEDIKRDVEDKCNKLDLIITDPDLRMCIEYRCRTGMIQVECFCPHMGAYWCPADRTAEMPREGGWITVCMRTREGDVHDKGETVIHEWAHSCNWQHGDGMGVPGDRGEDEYKRCQPGRPVGTVL